MAFELKHGSIRSDGVIKASVSKEDNDAFSARANDVFSNLKMTVQTDPGSKLLPSSSDEEEDLLPLCEPRAAKPAKKCVMQSIRRDGVIKASVSKEDNDAFSARANDVFSNLKMTVQTDAGPKLLSSSSEEEEDLPPLGEPRAAKPAKNCVLQRQQMV